MSTYHIHIRGIVQGVGFRPFVYKIAVDMGLNGNVSNTTDGVHIRINAKKEEATLFKDEVINNAPDHSVITDSTMTQIDEIAFSEFNIIESSDSEDKKVLLTPDFAMCNECKKEIVSDDNRRKGYGFTTCTTCGPRYSLIENLPYDRENTTMSLLNMCDACQQEYQNVNDRRYFSQTNSCQQCAINLILENSESGEILKGSTEELMSKAINAWRQGKIIGIKGIGGYLITCDATNASVINKLRKLKNRPTKPFAVMYHDFLLMAEDVDIETKAMLELQHTSAPIVLLPKKANPLSDIAFEAIAPGLKKVGVMLPYTPLYHLLLQKFGNPIVATSGNLSGDPIEYKNDSARENLAGLVDIFLHNDRDITLPQDDSVISITSLRKRKIIHRRSRGIAPPFILSWDLDPSTCILTMGGLLKSTFGLTAHGNIYISQYLGDTDSYLTQKNYLKVLEHFRKVLDAIPQAIVCDKHPSFFSSQEGERLASEWNIPLIKVQHHLAHFHSILGEHQLYNSSKPIMGIIWDGTGLGDDGNIWGGEFFICQNNLIDRIDHIPYCDNILGDKMTREPRISALSFAKSLDVGIDFLKDKFTKEEWVIYTKIIIQKSKIKCSSMGRLFDAIASIVLNQDYQSYEGEAAMLLENAAQEYFDQHLPHSNMSYLKEEMDSVKIIQTIVQRVIIDKNNGVDPAFISARFHVSLVDYIDRIAYNTNVSRLAFSGGVFQNSWLIDLIEGLLNKKHELYFHERLSPNDENISFGQLMYYYQTINK